MSKLNNDVRQIFSETLKGGIIITGNSCAIVGDINNKVKEYMRANLDPVPETVDWRNIGSSAYLDIPENSTVKYAVLEWHSTVANYIIGKVMFEEYSSITFTTPTETKSISIDKQSSNEAIFDQGPKTQTGAPKNKQSTKWVDVTELIKSSGRGFYKVKKIPTATVESFWNRTNHDQAPGWSLTVVYENDNSPLRNINIFMGLKQYTYETTADFNTLNISGFKIPQIPKKTYLMMVASNGDPNMYARVNVYPDLNLENKNDLKYAVGNTVEARDQDPKQGVIIPYDNLFSGIIMDTSTESENYGKIDIRGTFGQKNNSVFDILNQSSFKGNRGKMDILSFDISDKMSSEQENLYITIDLNKIPAARVQMIVYATQIDL